MITKLVFKCLFSIALFFGIANMLSYMSTGKTIITKKDLMFWKDWGMPSATTVGLPTSSFKTEVYKWVDENGVTHYSSEQAPEHLVSQKLAVDPNTNIIQGERKEPEPEEEELKEDASPMIQGPLYHPDSIKELTDKAKDVERLLQDRADSQNKILDSI